MADVRYWLWLSRLRKLSTVAAHKYLDHFGSVKQLYYASAEDYRRMPGAQEAEIKLLADKRLDEADDIAEKCEKLGIRILSLRDSAYPDRLRNIYDAPLVLYVRGSLPDIDSLPCMAIVGTRRASAYGRRCARRFAAEMTRSGGVIVSGLAEGIDSEAMGAAIEAGGPVIGVLGTGVDVVFPAWNAELQSAACEHGALISEYPPGARGSKISFPQRNRIISGISLGVVVIEAPERSGSLITAARASEQGRDVYVVPGNIDDPGFVGSNRLIRDGAALASDPWEILSCYRWQFPRRIQHRDNKKRPVMEAVRRLSAAASGRNTENSAKKAVDNEKDREYIDLKDAAGLSEDELAVIYVLSRGEKQADEIIQETGMDASDVLSAITMLELEGYIRVNDGQRFELTR
mgnify:FL=1